MERRSAAGLAAVVVCLGLFTAGSRPMNVHATFASGTITTQTGALGTGVATAVAQGPISLAYLPGTQHLLVGDENSAVVRDFNPFGPETVFAGNNAYGYRGNGVPATSAMINTAGAIVNCAGLTYFADSPNNVIREVDGGGNITTVAGNGTAGYSGDGGPATSAQLNSPFGLACRTGGGLYISDTGNGAIRILDLAGIIHPWWSQVYLPTGIVELGSQDVVAISETGAHTVWQLTDTTPTIIAGNGSTPGYFGDNVGATSAVLNTPTGLAYDGANAELFIADTGNNLIRRVAAGVIRTVAGQPPPALGGFGGDNGLPLNATLNQPIGLALTGGRSGDKDEMFIADSLNYRVREIVTTGGQNAMVTAAGNGSPSWSGDGGNASLAQLGNPFGVAFDGSGSEYISDTQDNVIRKITAGVISTVAGVATKPPGWSGDGLAATSAQLNSPRGIAVNAVGDVAIADTNNQLVRWVDHVSHNISQLAGNGVAGNSGSTGSAISLELNFPRDVAIDAAGAVFIADTKNNRVVKVFGGNMSPIAGTGTAGYGGDGQPALSAVLNGPRGLVFDGSGNLFISDANNNRVRRIAASGGVVTSSGTITTFAGNGTAGLAGDLNLSTAAELYHPYGLAIDGSGRLFIADSGNQRVRMVGTNGIITTVVASCAVTAGFAGDNGPAAIAQLNSPFGIAVSAAGDLFVADVNNNRVRQAITLGSARSFASCPSNIAPGPTTRGAANPGPGGSPGLRIPWLDRSSASLTGLATAPGFAPSAQTRLVPAAASAAAAPVAAVPPAAAKPVAAEPVVAAPVAAENAALTPAEPAPALTRRASAMVAPSRTDATGLENKPSYLPVVVVIALAIVVITLLAVRRRKIRRLIGHTRP